MSMPSFRKKKSPTRQPSGYQFAIADDIRFLNPEHWDQVTAGWSIFMTRRYLESAQEDFTDQLLRRFALIYDGATPVAALATQTFDVTADQLVGDSTTARLKVPPELRQKSLALVKRRVMMCGNVHTWGPHGLAYTADQDPARIWLGVADCLYRIRRADRLQGQTDYVIVKDLFDKQHQHAAAMQPFRYQALETEPNMVLTINPAWETIDDYMAGLTKRYRAAARKVLKPFATDDFTVGPMSDLSAESEKVYSLYQAVAEQSEVRLFSLQQDTLPRLAASLGDDFVAIGIRQENRLLGFVTVIRDGDSAIGYYLGIDYEANAALPIYHRLLLAVIQQAITWKSERISFGRTALDAKSRLGCHAETTHVWVRHRVAVLNFFVQQMLKNVSHAEPPERNPFKEVDETKS